MKLRPDPNAPNPNAVRPKWDVIKMPPHLRLHPLLSIWNLSHNWPYTCLLFLLEIFRIPDPLVSLLSNIGKDLFNVTGGMSIKSSMKKLHATRIRITKAKASNPRDHVEKYTTRSKMNDSGMSKGGDIFKKGKWMRKRRLCSLTGCICFAVAGFMRSSVNFYRTRMIWLLDVENS